MAYRDTLQKNTRIIHEPHDMIHAGKHAFFIDSNSLGSSVTRDILLVTPVNESVHFIMQVYAAGGQFWIYEDTVTTDDGTVQTTHLHNRQIADSSPMTVYLGPTISSVGTLLATVLAPVGKTEVLVISVERDDHEIVLKKNTKYLLRYTTSEAGILTNHFDWYWL